MLNYRNLKVQGPLGPEAMHIDRKVKVEVNRMGLLSDLLHIRLFRVNMLGVRVPTS